MTGEVSHNALGRARAGDEDAFRELIAPYQQRYFEVVGGIWRDWSSDMAQWFVVNAYPLADTHAVIEATDALIATTSPPAALRRLLIEGRDGVERALRELLEKAGFSRSETA